MIGNAEPSDPRYEHNGDPKHTDMSRLAHNMISDGSKENVQALSLEPTCRWSFRLSNGPSPSNFLDIGSRRDDSTFSEGTIGTIFFFCRWPDVCGEARVLRARVKN
jgi:hypothetical protein